jgi:hypothetical protein
MSTVSENLRRQITERAENCCEYCHLPTIGQVGRFPIDHVLPRSRGGLTELASLALACPHCNWHKGPNLTGIDPRSGKIVPLFYPRRQKWKRHFQWHGPLLVGRTQVGRATIAVLGMNQEERVTLREELTAEGLFPT